MCPNLILPFAIFSVAFTPPKEHTRIPFSLQTAERAPRSARAAPEGSHCHCDDRSSCEAVNGTWEEFTCAQASFVRLSEGKRGSQGAKVTTATKQEVFSVSVFELLQFFLVFELLLCTIRSGEGHLQHPQDHSEEFGACNKGGKEQRMEQRASLLGARGRYYIVAPGLATSSILATSFLVPSSDDLHPIASLLASTSRKIIGNDSRPCIADEGWEAQLVAPRGWST